uniref:Cytochrome c oxidase subunit 3 n=1 Tax=Paracarsidara gigantea TaxID=2218136 RepID=A0A344A2L3_9HEMI|nr:cytochrome c oxidase subunit 3 [Paracarsidara gigantea]AWU49004.1 cytochrome c oxidase subunit 3 [Paracarsidara gigantea]
MNKNHQFHLVDPSPWPMIISFILLNYTSFMVMMFNTKINTPMIMMMLLMLWTMMLWWRDIHRESTFQGHHTLSVMTSMKYGMILFIVSEILFFFSFFWSFFHHSLSPSHEIGISWPPMGIKSFNPMHIPLMNTIILLSSGISVTWTHASMLMNKFKETKKSLLMTIMLGVYFSLLQMYEYINAPFCFSDSVYGSTFFLTTGFHGIHVIIGTLFLTHSLVRMSKLHFSKNHHLSLEMAIWYWHFVDIVWLFLYISIYWWGK